MPLSEPTHTAIFLAVLGLLMGVSVLFSRTANRAGVPVGLLFILVGIAAGSEGLGHIQFSDYELAFRVGTVALVLILFDGGLNTELAAAKEGMRPAVLLATVGVAGTAGMMALGGRLFGLPWSQALLLGAIVSSTDAAAVFSVLRGSGIILKKRVGITLELESGLNDPMAVILTTAFTQALVFEHAHGLRILLDVVIQLGVGTAAGFAFGYGGRLLLKRVRLPAGGLYPVLTTALAFVTFAVPTLLEGSGFLAVYIAALLLGNEAIRYQRGLRRVHDALAWLAQIAMFLMLGLLAFPTQLFHVGWIGLGLGLVLALVARPLVVALCLWPFGYPRKEVAFMSWVGLRGAVPIILSTIPVLAGAPGAHHIFNVVFFIVVVNAVVPGSTVNWVTRKLGLVAKVPPPPQAALEITSTQLLQGELNSFYIHPASLACGATIADLPFPESAVATLIVRGVELVGPRGHTVLEAGDHLYVFCKPEDLGLVRLIFGNPDAE